VRSLINCVFANIMNATNESERRRSERHIERWSYEIIYNDIILYI